MNREVFEAALVRRRYHLSAFLVLGDPEPEVSLDLALAAIDAGATMLELGLPFSDPCADGPAIQASVQRALAGGTRTGRALELVARIHAARPEVPLNLMVYGNLVHAPGEEAFCRAAAEVGAATLLVPDIPLEESAPLSAACRRHGLGHAQLVGPETSAERLASIEAVANAYLYVAGYQGVTGARDAPGAALEDRAREVRRTTSLPLCLGFGLSRPEHLEAAFRGGSAMAVVGSHLARALEGALDPSGRAPAKELEAALVQALEPLAAAADQANRHLVPGTQPCSSS